METLWDVIKAFYNYKFNIPPEYIEYIACEPILSKCVEGFSNVSIAKRFNLPVDYIKEIIIEFLDFLGWDFDLDFSPIAVYKNSNENYDLFYQNVLMTSSVSSNENIYLLFNICKKFSILSKWARSIEKTIK